MKNKTGVIILGHGSKLEKANKTIAEIVRIIRREKMFKTVKPAYLQFHQPDLSRSIKKVVEAGCKKVIVVPFFLFTGNHVSRDIPRAIGKEARRYKEIDFVYTRSLGSDPRIGEIVLDRLREVLAL